MKVTLFRDLKEEGWFSMERYADQLVRKFKIQNSKFKVDEVLVPRQDLTPSNTVNLYYTRYFHYPLKARSCQGDVNHLVDHSYGHLVYALDPAKTVVTCHDLNPLKHEESWLNLLLFKYSVGGLKRAARIISDSEATKKDLIKFLGIAADKIVVIPLGVEERFRVIEDQKELDCVRKKFGISYDRRILMHVGGSGYNKNVEGILKAIAKIVNEQFNNLTIQQLIFIKIGSDFTEPQKTLIKELNLESYVKFLGTVSEEDLAALYNIADVFVFPSFYEGFGLPVLEAMACGTPVVTSNVSSLPEVAGDAAVYVDPFDVNSIAEGILKILHSNTAQYQSMVQHGLQQAKKFSWQKTAEETLRVYQEVCRKSL